MRSYSNMASSLPAFRYLLAMPPGKQIGTRPSSLQTRAEGCRDEGKSGIDANMSILRERIEEVRMKERLERCFRSENGWNYATGYHSKHNISKFFEISGMALGTLGLTIGTGTLCLCLFSLLAHLCQ
ncbi:uncharacterized protein LOC131302608 [Rhododendron vialii]|uniref:uncharacterized protein LOC131302608 n=1 Tax=Rhododendron vialii TaxID=182163 RepID=UPI00265E2898|nr:uncharacterized protein LOC131302608 [Rhododendron vialii]